MTRTTDESEALEIITSLHDAGFGDLDIADAMRDGEYLEKNSISQAVSELIYNHVTQRDQIARDE